MFGGTEGRRVPPGHSQIVSHTHGEKSNLPPIFLHGCKIKPGSGLGTTLVVQLNMSIMVAMGPPFWASIDTFMVTLLLKLGPVESSGHNIEAAAFNSDHCRQVSLGQKQEVKSQQLSMSIKLPAFTFTYLPCTIKHALVYKMP